MQKMTLKMVLDKENKSLVHLLALKKQKKEKEDSGEKKKLK